MSGRNLIVGVVAAHLCVLAVLALMGGCALEKKEPKLMSAAPVQDVRAPEGEPESILEPKGMVEEKDLLVSREPEMVLASIEPAETAATPAPPTPVPFTEEKAGEEAPAAIEVVAEEKAAAIAEKVAAKAKAPASPEAVAADASAPAISGTPAAAATPSVAPEAGMKAAAGRAHKVAPGESLWKIARLYGVTVADLAKENGLSADARVKAGRTLVIPSGVVKPASPEAEGKALLAAPAAVKPAVSGTRAPAAEAVKAPERPVIRQPKARPAAVKPAAAAHPRVAAPSAQQLPAGAVRRHVVRRGETLSLIARHYRVSMRKIMAANGIKDAGKIRVGMALVIPQQ